jgi:AraC-like DNA-binding protein
VPGEHFAPPVPHDLRPLVRGWTGYRYRDLEPGSHLGLPSPGLTIVISLGPPTALAATPDPAQGPEAFGALVGGLHTRPAVITYDTEMAGTQLDLTPQGARTLLGLPAGALPPAVLHLEDVLGRDARELHERLHGAPSWAARFELLAEALRGSPRALAPIAPALDHAWHLLVEGGNAKVRDVAREVGYSRRHLDERFVAEFGLTPKQAARVARFDRSRVALTRGAGRVSLAAVAAGCGFYDQAHMAREWNDLAGVPPSRWLADEDLPFVQDEQELPAASSAA